MRFYKVLNEDECHNGFQYHDGLNVDSEPFNPSGNCEPGGIYFAREDILAFLSYGVWIREVTIPEGEPIYENPGHPKKYKSHRVILGQRRRITPDVVQELIDEGADVNAGGDDPLHVVIHCNCPDIVKILINNGADINAGNGKILRYAIYYNWPDTVKFLIENGADVNARDGEPLRAAIHYNRPEIVKLLIERGADVNACDRDLLRIAKSYDNPEIFKILTENSSGSVCLR